MSHIDPLSWHWDQSQLFLAQPWWAYRHGTQCSTYLHPDMDCTSDTMAGVLLLLDQCGSMEELGDTVWL